MTSANDRFSGTFGDNLNTITGRWELLDDQGSWRPWMDITLTKQPARELARLGRQRWQMSTWQRVRRPR
jgi:hypothetical protein